MTGHIETTLLPGLDRLSSRIGLGAWAIGGTAWGGTDRQDALTTIRAALDSGITFIDTAPVYGFGTSEEIIGEALSAHGARERVILATKAGLEWNEKFRIVRNAGRSRIETEIDASLRRLRTDYLDLYQVHWPDPATPIEETATVMAELLATGKIRAIGVSNFTPDQIADFRRFAPVHTSQPPYNLFERSLVDQSASYCKANNVALVAYGALCRGLLSGAVTETRKFHGDDLRRWDPKFRAPRLAHYLTAVRRLDEFARERYGKRVLHLAVRWVLDRGASVALWGARRPDQLAPLSDIFGWSLDPAALSEIDRIVTECIPEPIGPEFMAPPPRPTPHA